MEMTNDDGVGGVDYSFECIGNVDVMRAALECCHKVSLATAASTCSCDMLLPLLCHPVPPSTDILRRSPCIYLFFSHCKPL